MNYASYVKFKKSNYGEKIFKMLLFYMKNGVPVNIFCNWLEHVLNIYSFYIISGDLNINAFD